MLDHDMCTSLAFNSSEALDVLYILATEVHRMSGAGVSTKLQGDRYFCDMHSQVLS